ncbi:DER1-domain-containing protein [Choiromyces venosus 120613-1]|uniref:Derlin n=1 Tax=Choiromyces venosus 120613-1 TaxID=1336337 RepID=A0A3N4JE00_9PEZI|nr:DER1-domain-containing protein [Choiromyces venosus 120613-1]
MSDLATFIGQAPPVSRIYAGLTFLLSFSAHVLRLQVVHPYYLTWYAPMVFNTTRPEIWRIVTSFMISGPKMAVILTPFFLYKYCSDCETTKFHRSGDLLVFIIFCGFIILLLNTFILQGMLLCGAMTLALAYYWTALENKNNSVHFFIVRFPVKYLPWVMIFVTLVTDGLDPALVEGTGIIAAHLYLFLTNIWPRVAGGRHVIYTPQWIHGLFEERGDPAARGIRAGVPPSVAADATGRRMFTASGTWTHRGQGHRLGS